MSITRPLIGLSSLSLYLENEAFQVVVRNIQTEKEHAKIPDLWELVDEGNHSLTEDRLKIVKELSAQGYKFTVHAPFNRINIASIDKDPRNESINRIKQSIDSASEIEAKSIVLHPGFRGENISLSKRINEDSILTLYEYAKSFGLNLVLENMIPNSLFFMSRPHEFEDFFRSHQVNLKLVFDAGHANLDFLVEEFISKLSQYFYVIHCHNNFGKKDEHLGIEDGTIDWDFVTSELFRKGFDGIFVVEACEKPYDCLRKLREKIRSKKKL